MGDILSMKEFSFSQVKVCYNEKDKLFLYTNETCFELFISKNELNYLSNIFFSENSEYKKYENYHANMLWVSQHLGDVILYKVMSGSVGFSFKLTLPEVSQFKIFLQSLLNTEKSVYSQQT